MKAVSVVMLTLLLMSLSTLAFNVQPARAGVTIYIRPDGTVEGTEKIQRDGSVYTFTDNIYDDWGIMVQIDNIVIDGAGYTLQGKGTVYTTGIKLTGRSNVTIKNMQIKAFYRGIECGRANNTISENKITEMCEAIVLRGPNNSVSGNNITNNLFHGIVLHFYSSNNAIFGNNIIANGWLGILLMESSNNAISGNNIIANGWNGIRLEDSSSNTICGNNIADHTSNLGSSGIWVSSSSNNAIYHNNFMNNKEQVHSDEEFSRNVWDDGYPSGGNYWNDHVKVDDHSGINQDEPKSDGIVDEPYIINYRNRDKYPLKVRWPLIPATVDFEHWNRGKWVPAYIELHEPLTVSDINVPTIKLNDTISIGKPIGVGDYDNDGVPDLMVKFDRAELLDWLAAVDCPQRGGYYFATLTISGKITDSKPFEGSESVQLFIKSK